MEQASLGRIGLQPQNPTRHGRFFSRALGRKDDIGVAAPRSGIPQKRALLRTEKMKIYKFKPESPARQRSGSLEAELHNLLIKKIKKSPSVAVDPH